MKPVSFYALGCEYGFAGRANADRKNAIYEAHANISAPPLALLVGDCFSVHFSICFDL